MFRITNNKVKSTKTWYLPSFSVRLRTLVAFLSFTYQLATGIALVPPGIIVPTRGALTLHELVHAVLPGTALLVQAPGLRRCPGLSVSAPQKQFYQTCQADVKPLLLDLLVQLAVLLADLV